MKLIRYLLVALFCFSAAHAGQHHGISATVVTGGKSQLNPNFLFNGGAYLLVNALKTGTGWGNVDGSRGGPAPNTLDGNGYPTSLANGGVTTQYSVESTADYSGTWVLEWVGGGTVSLPGCVGCGCPCSGTNQKITGWTHSSITPSIRITALTTGITKLAVYRSVDQSAYDSGTVFRSDGKAKIGEGGFGVIRHLNLQLANDSNITAWGDRTPINYAFYAGSVFQSAYYAGAGSVTWSTGDHYAVTHGSGGPTDKQQLHILFDHDSVGTTPTINLNGTGDVPIRNNGGGALVLQSTAPETGRTGTVVFDQALNEWLLFGGGAATFNVGIVGGMPPELLLQLNHEVGMNPWIVQPFLTAVPISDYMIQFATLIRDTGDSWMVPRFEGPSNELFNFIFPGTIYARNKAHAYWTVGGPTADENNYAGMGLSLLGQAISTVYSGNRSRYMLVGGVQQSTGNNTAGSDDRLAATSWVTAGTPTQSGYLVSPAYNWVTDIAPSTYVGMTQSDSAEIANAYSYVYTNAGNPTAQAALATAFVQSSYDPSCTIPFTTAHCSSGILSKTYLYQQWFAWAQGAGKPWAGKGIRMTAYEGGPSPDYFTVGSNGDTLGTGGTGTLFGIAGAATISSISAPGNPTTITLAANNAVPAIGMAVRPSGTGTALNGQSTSSASISAASPAQVTWAGNTLLANQPLVFQTSGIPAPLAIDTVYFVKTPGSPFTISLTPGGTAINTTGSAASGVTCISGWTVTNVVGQAVQLDVDSSSFGTSTPGVAQFIGVALIRNTLRYASKSAPLLQQLTLDNMNAFVAAGGNVPSDFQFTGNDLPATGTVWSDLASQYVATSPRWAAEIQFNAGRTVNWLLKRDIDPASNDNNPMWLAKAA